MSDFLLNQNACNLLILLTELKRLSGQYLSDGRGDLSPSFNQVSEEFLNFFNDRVPTSRRFEFINAIEGLLLKESLKVSQRFFSGDEFKKSQVSRIAHDILNGLKVYPTAPSL